MKLLGALEKDGVAVEPALISRDSLSRKLFGRTEGVVQGELEGSCEGRIGRRPLGLASAFPSHREGADGA